MHDLMDSAAGISNTILALLVVLSLWTSLSRVSFAEHSPFVDPKYDADNSVAIIMPRTLFPDVPNQIEFHSKHPLLRIVIGGSVHGLVNASLVTSYRELHQRALRGLYVTELPYRTPFVVSEGVAITLNITYDYCLDVNNFGAETSPINCRLERSKSLLWYTHMARRFAILMGETDKHLYRPGEIVRFRFLALNSRTIQGSSGKLVWPPYRIDMLDYAYPKLMKTPEEEIRRRETPPYFDSIYVEDPNRARLKEWTSVQQPTALNLSFRIPDVVIEGRWLIVARLLYEVKELEIEVRRYALPRFLVSLTAPEEISLTEHSLQLRVCAAYTSITGFFRGRFAIQVCFCSKSVWEHQQELGTQFQDNACLSISPNAQSVLSRCVQASGLLEPNPENGSCVQVKSSIRDLMKEARARTHWDQQLGAVVKVTEEFAVDAPAGVTKFAQIGIRVHRAPKIELKVDPAYRTGLPIFGRVRVSGLEDFPVPNTTVSISVEVFEVSHSFEYWSPSTGPSQGEIGPNIFKAILTPDEQGSAAFVIPPLSGGHDLRVQARVNLAKTDSHTTTTTTTTSTLRDRLCPHCSAWIIDNEISTYEQVRYWQSRSPLALAVEETTYDTGKACPSSVKLSLLVNAPLDEKDIFMFYLLQGAPRRISATLRSTLSSGQACTGQDGPLGHYTCNAAFKPGEVGEITCLSGWTGDNCMTPDCPDIDCGVGRLCVAPGVCSCRDGWHGENCEICEPRKGCLHGDCKHGNDCVCREGFTGYLCDQPHVLYDTLGDMMPLSAFNFNIDSDNLPLSTASPPPLPTPSESSPGVRRTFFKYEAVFEMNSSLGPTLRAVVYVYHQGSNNEVPEIVADYVKIGGFRLCSTPTLVKGKLATRLLNRHTVLPGDMFQLTLSLPTAGANADAQTEGIEHACILRMSSIPFENPERHQMGSFIDLQTYVNQLEDFFYQGDFPVFSTKTAFEAAGIDFIQVGPVRRHSPRAVMWPVFTQFMDSDQFASSAFSDSDLPSPPTRPFSPDSLTFSSSWLFDYVKLQPDTPSSSSSSSSLASQVFAANLTAPAPAIVGNWELSATCISPHLGLWMPQRLRKESLRVTLPFHFEFTPVTKMRLSEVLHPSLSVSMLSFERRVCYELSVSLTADDADWQVIGSRNMLRCICAGDSKATFRPLALTPRRLGHLSITVRVLALPGSPMCSEGTETDADVGVSIEDTIRRHILVVPSGQEIATTVGGLLCLSDSPKLKQTLPRLPQLTIQSGTLHNSLSACGNILGRLPDNLNRLLPLPEGSALQSVVTVSASVDFLKYLSSMANITEQEVKSLLKSALRHIHIGYASLLAFSHQDGSFSSLGQQSTPYGSTWFTALVFGVLSEADKIIKDLKSRGLHVVSLDSLSTLLEAFDFLLTVQRADGCFIEDDTASRSRLPVSSAADNRTAELALTSYVLSALSDIVDIQRIGNASAYEASVRSAVMCLLTTVNALDTSRLPTSVLALISFALSRAPTGVSATDRDRVQGLLAELRRRAFEQEYNGDRLRWWADDASADPAPTVEATAYALLTLSANQTSTENLAVIRWLLQQPNERGGFHTTQDTVVAVRALVYTAIGLPRPQVPFLLVNTTLCDLDSATPVYNYTEVIPLSGLKAYTCTRKDLSDHLTVSKQMQSVVWELSFSSSSPQPENEYCVSVGLARAYYTLEATNDSLFALEVVNNQGSGAGDTGGDVKRDCTQARVNICVRPSEMAIQQSLPLTTGIILLSVQLPTGWETNLTEPTFLGLQRQPSAPLHVELDAANRTVLAYFQAFTEVESREMGGRSKLLRCLTLDLQHTMLVESLAPSIILVQDYFAPHRSTSRAFTPNICRENWGQQDRWRSATEGIQLDRTATAAVGCPRCAGMPRKSLMRAIEESLCLEKGSLLLFSPVQQQQQLESIVGTVYAMTVGETIAVWNATLNLTDQCPCEILTAATTTVCAMLSTSPHHPVVGATEMGGLADFDIVKLSDVEQVIKGHSLSEAELNHCAGWRGLRRLLRKWSSVYS